MPADFSAVELSELADRLVRSIFGLRATAPQPLAAGEWSQAFALTIDGSEVVLRLGAHGTDFAKDDLAASFAGPDLPVPSVLAKGNIDEWHYAISARADGTRFDDLSAAEVAQALPALLAAIDEIGRIDVADTAGYGIWSPDGRAPYNSWVDALIGIGVEAARVPGWRLALSESEIGLGPVDAGLAAIAALATYLPDERRMIHGDLLAGNVLVAGDIVTGVLDWGNALYGDNLYDAAWLVYWWPWYPPWRGIDIYAELLAHLRTNRRLPAHVNERLHAYLIHIGLDAIAYCTFKRRWDEVRFHADTVLALAASAPGVISPITGH